MQDYNINVNYGERTSVSKTSPKSTETPFKRFMKKTKVKPVDGYAGYASSLIPSSTKVAGGLLAGAAKINSYVGSLTENTVTQRKRQLGVMATALGFVALSNPITAVAAAGIYVANSAIQYNIKQFKENLSAEFLRDLSGGTVNTRR